MAAELKAVNAEAEGGENAAGLAASTLSTLSQGMMVWAGVVSLLLLVIVAMIFRRLRARRSSGCDDDVSVCSDAESGRRGSFGTCSVVDVDAFAKDQDLDTLSTKDVDIHSLDNEPTPVHGVNQLFGRPKMFQSDDYRPSMPGNKKGSQC